MLKLQACATTLRAVWNFLSCGYLFVRASIIDDGGVLVAIVFFIYFKILFSHIFHPNCCSPSFYSSWCLPHSPSLPDPLLFSFPWDITGTSSEHCITYYNKSRHIMWQPIISKRVTRGSKKVRGPLSPTIRSPTRTPYYTNLTYMQRT